MNSIWESNLLILNTKIIVDLIVLINFSANIVYILIDKYAIDMEERNNIIFL